MCDTDMDKKAAVFLTPGWVRAEERRMDAEMSPLSALFRADGTPVQTGVITIRRPPRFVKSSEPSDWFDA